MTLGQLPQSVQPHNAILKRIDPSDLTRLSDRGERVTVPLRSVVSEPGEATEYAFFPFTNVFSSIVPLRDGSAIEAATIGKEGLTGTELLANHSNGIYRTIQQVEGESLRVPVDLFRRMLAEGGSLHRVVQCYALTLTHHCGQKAACNLRHSVEERMCRWLLMTHDRVGKDQFFLTHEFLGIMLGVRRQSVSLTASILQEAGLITYNRGHVTIRNRSGLERTVCECYEALNETYQQVMRKAGK